MATEHEKSLSSVWVNITGLSLESLQVHSNPCSRVLARTLPFRAILVCSLLFPSTAYTEDMPSTDDRSRERRRSRSRSPHRSVRNVLRRSRSPRFPRRRRYDGEGPSETSDTRLPFDARPISKHDLPRFRPMFGLYLDIQKQLVLEELTGHEVRGRWKSFVSKW